MPMETELTVSQLRLRTNDIECGGAAFDQLQRGNAGVMPRCDELNADGLQALRLQHDLDTGLASRRSQIHEHVGHR